MLEALRRNSRNTIIYILFGVIIAVFIINFGPGSRGCAGGPGSSYAAKVGSTTISEQEYREAYIALGGANISPQFAKLRRLKEFVMDKLIERTLFIHEAERLGLNVSKKEVEDMIADGRMVVLGVPRKLDNYVFVDGAFNYDHFKAVCQNSLGVTVARFIEEQQGELMAERVRQLMLAGTRTTPDEVKQDWLARETTVNLEFVRFQPRRYADTITLTPAEIEAYRKAHEADLKKQYDERSFLYKKVDREAHLLRVSVEVPKDAPQDKIDAAKAKADDALKQLKAGKPFADVAKALSDDEHSKVRGGDMGWRKKGYTGLGAPVDEQVFAAKKGDLLGPVRSDRGWEVLQVVDFREGDIPFEAVASEIAEEQLRNDKAKEKAKADADAAMAKLKGGAKLAELFPKPAEEEADPIKRMNQPPSVQETGPFPRRGELIPDLGVSAELLKKAFQMKPGEIAGPYDVSSSWVVVQLKDRKDPDVAEFDKKKGQIMRDFEREKWASVVDSWSKDKCNEVKTTIQVNDEVLAYEGSKTPDTKYEPCCGQAAKALFGGM